MGLRLFRYENYQVIVEPEALKLLPFKKIYTRDRSSGKTRSDMEFSFIYFFCDTKSDYMYLTDEKERMKAIKEAIGLPKEWKPDKQLQKAMEFYSSFKTMSELLLEDTRVAVDKLRKQLRDINLGQTDDKGKLVYTLQSVTSTIKLIPSLVEDLNKAEKALSKEHIEDGRMRGGAEKAIMEDSLDD